MLKTSSRFACRECSAQSRVPNRREAIRDTASRMGYKVRTGLGRSYRKNRFNTMCSLYSSFVADKGLLMRCALLTQHNGRQKRAKCKQQKHTILHRFSTKFLLRLKYDMAVIYQILKFIIFKSDNTIIAFSKRKTFDIMHLFDSSR